MVFPLFFFFFFVFGEALAWYSKVLHVVMEACTLPTLLFMQRNLRLDFFLQLCIMEGICAYESKFTINRQYIYTTKKPSELRSRMSTDKKISIIFKLKLKANDTVQLIHNVFSFFTLVNSLSIQVCWHIWRFKA